MKTKRVLVTGASGFIGRPLVAALLRAGYAVRAATRRQVSFPDSVEVALVPDLKIPLTGIQFCAASISSFTWRVRPTAKFLRAHIPNSIKSTGLPRSGWLTLPKTWGLNALSIFHRCGPK